MLCWYYLFKNLFSPPDSEFLKGYNVVIKKQKQNTEHYNTLKE